MGIELPTRWKIGRVTYRHQDYTVCEMEQFNKVGAVLATFDSAEDAVQAASELGNGYAACRRVRSGSEVRPRELLTSHDLPVRLKAIPFEPDNEGRPP